MSLLTVQFGQCGNQIGCSLFSLMSQDADLMNTKDMSYYFQDSLEKWFHDVPNSPEYLAKAILVDTEQKVINGIQRRQSTSVWKYDPNNVILHKGGGAGNNWAFGYGHKGPELRESIMECVRHNVEKSDLLCGFFSILSCAGGTGSGLGSYIIEELREEYPTKMFINNIILPYITGEVITQNYNTVLTLAKLYDVTDMFLLFSNDHIHKMCINLLKNEDTDFWDLNDVIAMKIGSIFQPIYNDGSCLKLDDVVGRLATHRDYKFVSIKSAPHYPKESKVFEMDVEWNSLAEHMKQSLREVDNIESALDWEIKPPRLAKASKHRLVKYVPCISNLLVLRGELQHAPTFDFSSDLPYPRWVPPDSRCQHYHQKRKFLGMDKFISLATNNSSIIHPVNNITEQAWNKYIHRAHGVNVRQRKMNKIHSYAHQPQGPSVQQTFQVWPEREKRALLEAMKKYGHSDLDSLSKALPGKSKDNIKMAIALWWKSARVAMMSSSAGSKNPEKSVKSKKVEPTQKAPIDQWLQKLEQNQPLGGFQETKMLAKVLLYISKFERHPSPIECNGIDYKYPRTGTVRQYGGRKKQPEPSAETALESSSPICIMKKLLEVPGFNPLKVPPDLLKK
ncbi:hypothetical protein C0J52_05502 [Blattella germanica]|nr:hypothetical protein C0J52_05502 [Blattella germanica]